MGLLKKITRPISKFLDKVVPNEIKPALPYLSAFAPFMMGPTGIMGSSMLRRALMSGALNLGSQLSQEGSEGEFNPLSVLLAGSTGAMTSPDAPGFFKGMQREVPYKDMMTDTVISPTPDTGIMASIKHGIGKGGETASKFLAEQGDILRPGGEPLTLKNALTATSVPVTTGTADLARITAEQALRDFENQEGESGMPGGYTDEGRRIAIRSAMEAAGHIEEDILDAIASLGLKEGGRVGYIHGGITHADGRRGFFKGAEADARAGRASMSPGTSHSGGMRAGFGNTGNTGTGTTTTTPTPKTKTIKTSITPTTTPTTSWAEKFKGWFGMGDPEEVDLGSGLAEIAKNQIIANKTATTNAIANLVASGDLDLAQGGRVGAEGGGIMNAKRGLVDAPGGYAGLEEIEDMREFRIANPNIEDVADYKGYYERLKNPQNYDEQGFEIKEEVDFGGVKEAVGNIAEENELVASRQNDLFMLREEAIMKSDFDKIKEIEFDFFKEFGIPMPAAQNISDEAPVQMAAKGGIMHAKRGLVDGPGGYAGRELGDILEHGWWYPKTDSEPFNQSEYDEKLKKAEENLKKSGEQDRNFEVEMFTKTQKRLQEDGLEFGDAVEKAEIINYYQYGKGALEGKTYQGNDPIILEYLGMTNAKGGRVNKNTGGMMSVLPKGREMDYRGGGVIPMGSKERADDVPARLSKNEFVMTADAVRAAGGGSVNKGAKRMYNLMHKLEARV